VSHIDGSVGAVNQAEAAVAGSEGQVYANDLELRGVYTGPYTQVSDLPPSLGHLSAPELKTLKTQAVPLELARPVVAEAPPGNLGGVIKVLLGLAVVGAGVAFAFKLGLI
jgi:hypothetical protein